MASNSKDSLPTEIVHESYHNACNSWVLTDALCPIPAVYNLFQSLEVRYRLPKENFIGPILCAISALSGTHVQVTRIHDAGGASNINLLWGSVTEPSGGKSFMSDFIEGILSDIESAYAATFDQKIILFLKGGQTCRAFVNLLNAQPPEVGRNLLVMHDEISATMPSFVGLKAPSKMEAYDWGPTNVLRLYDGTTKGIVVDTDATTKSSLKAQPEAKKPRLEPNIAEISEKMKEEFLRNRRASRSNKADQHGVSMWMGIQPELFVNFFRALGSQVNIAAGERFLWTYTKRVSKHRFTTPDSIPDDKTPDILYNVFHRFLGAETQSFALSDSAKKIAQEFYVKCDEIADNVNYAMHKFRYTAATKMADLSLRLSVSVQILVDVLNNVPDNTIISSESYVFARNIVEMSLNVTSAFLESLTSGNNGVLMQLQTNAKKPKNIHKQLLLTKGRILSARESRYTLGRKATQKDVYPFFQELVEKGLVTVQKHSRDNEPSLVQKVEIPNVLTDPVGYELLRKNLASIDVEIGEYQRSVEATFTRILESREDGLEENSFEEISVDETSVDEDDGTENVPFQVVEVGHGATNV